MDRKGFLGALATIPLFRFSDIVKEEQPTEMKMEEVSDFNQEELEDIYIFGHNIKVVHFRSRDDAFTIVQNKAGHKYKVERLK